MSDTYPEEVIANAMKPIIALEVPPVLRASIDRHGANLMELVISLLDAGLAEQRVRSVIDKACLSYRDELIAAIFELRGRHET